MNDEVILPFIPTELPYVLKEHRGVPSAPTWYLKPLSLGELASLQDGMTRVRLKAGSNGKPSDNEDHELNMYSGRQQMKVLVENVIRVENLKGYDETGHVVDLELPQAGIGGAAKRQREEILRRLRPAWRVELSKALMDDAWLSDDEGKD